MNKLLAVLAMAALFASGISCGKKDNVFRIDLVKYLDNSYTQSFEANLRKGLEDSGMVEGVDYALKSRSAQGDMPTLALLLAGAENSRTDLLVTFQSPTLYAAILRAPSVKKMFTLLQNPFILGAGESDDNHLKNLTGLYMVPPFEELLDTVAQCQPRIQTLGTIYDPGNDDSVFRKDELIRIAAERNMQVTVVPYTAQNEIKLAADTLLASSPQGIIHLQDPSQDVTFPVLYKSASQRKIPVFSLVYNMEKIGATIACSTDRDEVGRQFAQLVVRVVRGEDPSYIPFETDRALKKRFGYNRTAATEARLALPESLLQPTE